jgi:hypothetical protein
MLRLALLGWTKEEIAAKLDAKGIKIIGRGILVEKWR